MGNEESKLHKHEHKSKKSQNNTCQYVDKFLQSMCEFIQGEVLPLKTFLDYFSNSPTMRLILLKNSTVATDTQNLDLVKLKTILFSMTQAATGTDIFSLYLDLLFNQNDELDYLSLCNVIEECFTTNYYLIGYKKVKITNAARQVLKNIFDSINFTSYENGTKIVAKNDFKEWIINEFSQVFFGTHNWFIKRIKEFKMPTESDEIQAEEVCEDFSMLMNQALVWYLFFNLPGIYTKNLSSEQGTLLEKFKNCCKERRWKLLFNSEDHGLSLNRFQSSLFNYKAPTIMLVYCQSGSLYCVGSTTEYKHSPTGYGDSQTRIFRIWPELKVFPVSDDGNIYLQTKSKGLQQGLIIGYNNLKMKLKPVLNIDDSLHHIEHDCKSKDVVISIEVWGCGTDKDVEYQNGIKKWENKNLEKMRTSKPSENWLDGNADKTLLDLAGIKTEHSERGDF